MVQTEETGSSHKQLQQKLPPCSLREHNCFYTLHHVADLFLYFFIHLQFTLDNFSVRKYKFTCECECMALFWGLSVFSHAKAWGRESTPSLFSCADMRSKEWAALGPGLSQTLIVEDYFWQSTLCFKDFRAFTHKATAQLCSLWVVKIRRGQREVIILSVEICMMFFFSNSLWTKPSRKQSVKSVWVKMVELLYAILADLLKGSHRHPQQFGKKVFVKKMACRIQTTLFLKTVCLITGCMVKSCGRDAIRWHKCGINLWTIIWVELSMHSKIKQGQIFILRPKWWLIEEDTAKPLWWLYQSLSAEVLFIDFYWLQD